MKKFPKAAKKASAVKALIGSMTGGAAPDMSTGGLTAPPPSKGKSKMSFGKRKTFGAIAVLACILSLQAPTRAQATATASWVQGNTLTDATTFKYALLDLGPTPAPPPVAVTNPTCAVVQAVVVCQGQVPLPSAGPHKFSLTATSPDGNLSAASPVLTGVMPGAPTGFKVIVTTQIVPTPPGD